jgi:hypothetical protein
VSKVLEEYTEEPILKTLNLKNCKIVEVFLGGKWDFFDTKV